MVSLGYFSLPKQREEHKERPFSQEIPGQARDEGNKSPSVSVPLATLKVLPFGKVQINLAFRSLIRTFIEGTFTRQ